MPVGAYVSRSSATESRVVTDYSDALYADSIAARAVARLLALQVLAPDDFQARDATVRSRSLAPGDAEAPAPAPARPAARPERACWARLQRRSQVVHCGRVVTLTLTCKV